MSTNQPSTDQMSGNELQIHVAYHAAEQELLKHIATLDTAALLFVSAFLGKGLIHRVVFYACAFSLVLGLGCVGLFAIDTFS